MWRITEALGGETVQLGQQALTIGGMRLSVDEMSVGGPTGLSGLQVKSGLITRTTRVTYRSQSARLFLLIQLSSEMWDFAMDGELYFEKILGFLRVLFLQWQVTGISHFVSIILFSRTVVTLSPSCPDDLAAGAPERFSILSVFHSTIRVVELIIHCLSEV